MSSNIPTAKAIKEAAKMENISSVLGRNMRDAPKTPKNKGMPPPLGTGFLWITPGCFLLGSSKTLNFFKILIDRGVRKNVMKKADRNDARIVKFRLISQVV